MFGDVTCEVIYCFYFYTLNNANSSRCGSCTLVTCEMDFVYLQEKQKGEVYACVMPIFTFFCSPQINPE